MERRLQRFFEVTDAFGARPSFPITARVLARHPRPVQRLAESGVEFVIHGLVHNDHSRLDLEEQLEGIARAAKLFRAYGVPYSGFRCPFLRGNAATERAVRSLGMEYYSTQPVVFSTAAAAEVAGGALAAYRRTLRQLYGTHQQAERVLVRPTLRAGLVHIPVSLPDHEILVERLHTDARAQARVWLEMLESTWRAGELFTLQLHPERIFECEPALRALLAAARDRRPPGWIATLGEVAEWWRARSTTALRVERLEDGRFRVRLEGDARARLLIRGLPELAGEDGYGDERVSTMHDFELRSERAPIVGVSYRTHSSVLALLAEEGYVMERAAGAAGYGAWIDEPGDAEPRALVERVEASPGPLLRLARWPAGARSALAVTGDIDCMTIQDFALRLWEARR
jgi:hypothetical protein